MHHIYPIQMSKKNTCNFQINIFTSNQIFQRNLECLDWETTKRTDRKNCVLDSFNIFVKQVVAEFILLATETEVRDPIPMIDKSKVTVNELLFE